MSQELTSNEKVIMTYVVAGLTKKEIAAKIHRSFHAVDAVYRNIFRKLNIRKDTEIVREWFILRYNINRAELNQALKHPAIYGVAFFLTISLTTIILDNPNLQPIRTSRAARAPRARRARNNDFLFDPEKHVA